MCRLHEALQEVHQMLVRPPVPINPLPAVSNTFLRYGCRLDLWDSRLVSIIILSLYGCNSVLCCCFYCSLSVTALYKPCCSADLVFVMYSMVQLMQSSCKLCKVTTSSNNPQHQRHVLSDANIGQVFLTTGSAICFVTEAIFWLGHCGNM